MSTLQTGEASAAAPRMGAKIRRLRRQENWSQASLANKLGISASYLNLIEHNRRNVTVPLLLKLADLFEIELNDVAEDDEGRLAADLMEMFGDDVFDDHDLTNNDVRDLVATNPVVGRAVLSLYDAFRNARQDMETLGARAAGNAKAAAEDGEAEPSVDRLPSEQVSDFIQRSGNHFAELEAEAERIGQDVRQASDDLYQGMATFLENSFGVRVALRHRAPTTDIVRRFDPDRRVVDLSDILSPGSRRFQLAHQIGLLASGHVIDECLAAGGIAGDEVHSLGRIALANYFAAALLMPYGEFLRRAKATRYDIEVLEHDYGLGFEHICHRLTTLQRPRARGIPFHMLRVDIAGNVSKRFSLSGIHIPRHGGACPRWNVYSAFLQPGRINVQVSNMPDGSAYFCLARTVHKRGGGYGAPESILSIGLGCEIGHASEMVYSDGIDLENPNLAVPIGASCRTCPRLDCRQRAVPPAAHRLELDENVRGPSAYVGPV